MIFEQDDDDIVVMEAQNGTRTAGDAFQWLEIADVDASGGLAIQPSGETWRKELAGSVEWRFKIDTAGDYNIFARIKTRGREGKIWVELDGQLHAVGPDDNGRLYYSTSNYSWQNGYDNALVSLAAGIHVLKIRSLLQAVVIDRMAIVPDGSTDLEVGDSSIGPAEVSTGDEPENPKPYNYSTWLADTTRDHKRVLLIELDHSGGTTYLGSSLFFSETQQGYAPWISGDPVMEYSLKTLNDGIGDVYAVLPDDVTDDWINKQWRGYRARFYFGDADWPKSRFRLFGAATIDALKTTGTRSYRFELVSDIKKYSSTFYSGSTTRTENVKEAIEWICAQGGVDTPIFLNMDDGELDISVTYDVDENTTMYDAIKLIASTVDAYPTVNQNNVIEILKPNTSGEPTQTISQASIEDESVNEVDVMPAYARVRIECPAGSVLADTNADTGDYDEEIVITTAHAVLGDAQSHLAAIKTRYSKPQRTHSISVFYLSSLLREGDYVAIDHHGLTGAGVITNYKPAFVEARGTIEVQI